MKQRAKQNPISRWAITGRCSFAVLAIMLPTTLAADEPIRELSSPAGVVSAMVAADDQGRLTLSVRQGNSVVIHPSPLGIVVDGTDLGLGVRLGSPQKREIHEKLVCRGVKSTAVNHCHDYTVPVMLSETNTAWTLEVRVFDDGVAYRYRVPGDGKRTINRESTAWRLPKECPIWLQNNTANYEGNYYRSTVAAIEVQDDDSRKWLGCPVTMERPEGGYALITEACVYGYSGMTLRAIKDSTLQAVFQDDPNGWQTDGEILSPWRVTVVTPDLNALVNTDLDLQPGPSTRSKELFPKGMETDWIRPGKGLITWAVFLNDGAQWFRQKWFVDMCAAMNCEYLLGRRRLAHRAVGFLARRRRSVGTLGGIVPIRSGT